MQPLFAHCADTALAGMYAHPRRARWGRPIVCVVLFALMLLGTATVSSAGVAVQARGAVHAALRPRHGAARGVPRGELPSVRAAFETRPAARTPLDSILVTWTNPRNAKALGSPTGYGCYKGASRARLVLAESVRPHAELRCLFGRPKPGTYFVKVRVRFPHGVSVSSRVLSVKVPKLPPAVVGVTVHVASSPSTAAGANAGTYTYTLSWSAPATADDSPPGYFTYDVFLEPAGSSGGAKDAAAITPLLVGTTPTTTYIYTVPYQPGVGERVFGIGAVHGGVMGPLTDAS